MHSSESGSSGPWHGTTILTVRKGGVVAIGGDGQVSIGQTIVKSNARKVRRLGGGEVIGGFAGATADAFTLFERLESKLEQYRGQLMRAAVEVRHLRIRECIAQRQHRHAMRDRAELRRGHAAHALRRRVGCHDLRMFGLEETQLLHQPVVLGGLTPLAAPGVCISRSIAFPEGWQSGQMRSS